MHGVAATALGGGAKSAAAHRSAPGKHGGNGKHALEPLHVAGTRMHVGGAGHAGWMPDCVHVNEVAMVPSVPFLGRPPGPDSRECCRNGRPLQRCPWLGLARQVAGRLHRLGNCHPFPFCASACRRLFQTSRGA